MSAKIKIDKDLYGRAVDCARELGYSSVEEFVTHLIERAVREREELKDPNRAAMEERLRGLGYIE